MIISICICIYIYIYIYIYMYIYTDEPSINRVTLTDEGRISGVFCSKTVFNLSHKMFTETEKKLLKKGLGFAPV